MGRKVQEINPVCGKRIKELMTDNNLKQKEFAQILGYTEQHISALVQGKRHLSDQAAIAIAKKFPPVRYEWLMGYDDFKNPETAKYGPLILKFANNKAKQDAFDAYLKSYGFYFEMEMPALPWNDEEMAKLTNEEFFQELANNPQKIASALECALSERKYYLKSTSGEILLKCSEEQKDRFSDDIADYLEFRINKLIKEAGDSNGNH